MQKYRITPLSEETLPGLMALQSAMLAELPDPRWYFASSEELFAGMAAQGAQTRCFCDGDTVAAFAMWICGEKQGEEAYARIAGTPAEASVDFTDIMVHPAHRRQGIHSQCIREVAAYARSIGRKTVYATVDPMNIPSRSAFEKGGFVYVCERVIYDGRPRVLYRLDVSAN